MVTVTTEEEFTTALKNREKEILCRGRVAEKFNRRKKRKKLAKWGGIALAVGSAAALPFTGGTSAAGIASGAGLLAGASAAGLSITMSVAELAIICGASIAIYGIKKNSKVTFNSDGTVTVEPQYK